VQEDAGRLLLRQRITTATDNWISDGRDPADLMRGAPLAAAAEALDATAPGVLRLTADEAEFVVSSLAAQRSAEDSERRRRLRQVRGLAALTTSLGVLAVLVTLVEVALRRYTIDRSREAQRIRCATLSGQSAARTPHPDALGTFVDVFYCS
jgi:hypothetical protein